MGRVGKKYKDIFHKPYCISIILTIYLDIISLIKGNYLIFLL